uniref:Rab3 GTPase-activating protein catalytic subunit n=1 Tax=Caenorhabditis japonica TaxID=281687 RepID=A0A8R1I284_CAEJA
MDENTVFEINDFTNVTDMESFGAAFESILQKHVSFGRRPFLPNDVKYKMVVTATNFVKVGTRTVQIELLQPVANSSSEHVFNHPDDENEGENKNPEIDESIVVPFTATKEMQFHEDVFLSHDDLTVKFGVRECILISSSDDSDNFTDESQYNIIVGEIKTVIHMTGCEIPVFCYIKEKTLDFIQGYASDGNECINFTSSVLRNINKRHCNLHDLLLIFKEHLGAGSSAFHDDVRICSRFTHIVKLRKSKYHRLYTTDSFTRLANGLVDTLPFDTIQIVATWKGFRENSLTENHNYSDFDVNYASYWSVKINPSKNIFGVFDEILGVYSDNKRKQIKTDITCGDILEKHYVQQTTTNAFQKLTVNSASDVRFGNSHQSDREGTTGPVAPAIIQAWVDFIFQGHFSNDHFSDELQLMNDSNVYSKDASHNDIKIDEDLENLFNCPNISSSNDFLAPYKCAKKDTTTWRLAVALANVRVYMRSEPHAEPQLWIEFLLQLRKKYENMEDVEIVPNGIDHTLCGFSQKMQMIQLCINARKKRHAILDCAHMDKNDEFFDASETFRKNEICESDVMGRREKSSMMLIGDPELPMYLPITQDPCPLTDEMIDQRNSHLFSLEEEARVNEQMELILSDMQSFKAANPSAVFADFLRWHSPKDYNEKTETISERMLIPNNVWLRSWDNTKPVPAVNQKRIFNYTKIAEETFEQFENATLETVRQWIKPTVFAATLERMAEIESAYETLEDKKAQKVKIAKTLANATQNIVMADYNTISNYCCQSEIIHNMKIYLIHLFEKARESMEPPLPSNEDIRKAVKSLVNKTVANIWENSGLTETDYIVKPQEPIGRALAVLCQVDKITEKQLLNSERKEYIFSWILKNSAATGHKLFYRMYADLRSDKHSLYFANNSDCNFFSSSFI